jgi:hypothetical protein
MSTIGGMTATGMNLAGSIAGAARADGGAGHAKAPSAPTAIGHDATIKESPDDVADAQFSADRDADGRQLYQRRAPQPQVPSEPSAEDVSSATEHNSHAADAFGDRGNALDLDA